MKIEIEVSDLELFSKAFNNAVVALGDITSAIIFGLDPQINSTKSKVLESLPQSDLEARMDSLKDVYYQILEIEGREAR